MVTAVADVLADPEQRPLLVAWGGGMLLDWLLSLACPHTAETEAALVSTAAAAAAARGSGGVRMADGFVVNRHAEEGASRERVHDAQGGTLPGSHAHTAASEPDFAGARSGQEGMQQRRRQAEAERALLSLLQDGACMRAPGCMHV